MNIVDCINDPNLLGQWFAGPSLGRLASGAQGRVRNPYER